ncbi:MAG: nuclear transport factor 2 family protein [Gemmatimonadales bacterium]|nr:nuclear transport factor 2 family protein [Gemmatimonadales bacterium]
MRPFTSVVPFLLAIAVPLAAQSHDTERKVALATVHRLFKGMRKGDSSMVRAVFHPQALLATTLTRQGAPTVQVDTLESFLRAVGTPHDEVWDERMRGERVEIDGPLAAVWVEYSFYAGGRFSHCGVNAIQVARSSGGWRIIALTDTRRREGCPDEAGR